MRNKTKNHQQQQNVYIVKQKQLCIHGFHLRLYTYPLNWSLDARLVITRSSADI